jgi:hypothetical protein
MKRFVFITVVFLVSSVSVLAQTGGLKGKIRTSKGDGIANVVVTVRRDGKDVKTAKSDGKGNFTIQGLEAGSYNLVFDGKGYSSGLLQNVEVKKDKIRELPDRLVLTVDQGTLVIINGSVFNQDGRSVTGAEVFIEKTEFRRFSEKTRQYLHERARRIHVSPAGRHGEISLDGKTERRYGEQGTRR